MSSQKYIVTGGPGSGKTTLIEQLGARGCRYSEEVSRRLIRQQMSVEDGVLPWRSLSAFAELALDEMLREHDRAGDGLMFFDRGIPDIFGYLCNSDLSIPGRYLEVHDRCRYAKTVFLLAPWQEIYVNDEERPQSFEQAVALYHAIAGQYRALGYELVEVPRGSGGERADFVLSRLPQKRSRAPI